MEFISLKKSGLTSLFKYSRFDSNGYYKELLNNTIYFPNITELNDPFDSQTPVRYDLCKDDELDQLIIRTIPNYDKTNASHHIIRLDIKSELRKNPSVMEKRISNLVQERVGIFALTESLDNLLLWSHYSENHKGFCVEYDAQKLYALLVEVFFTQNVKAFIFKVEYQAEYPEIIPRIDNSTERLKLQFLIKSNHWEYEQEWRILILDGIRKNEIPSGFIKNVYFGFNALDDNIKSASEILKFSNPGVGLYKAKKKKYAFGLDFEKLI